MSATTGAPPGTLRILIVDDETIVRDSLGAWFRQDGHTVDTAENAREALGLDRVVFVPAAQPQAEAKSTKDEAKAEKAAGEARTKSAAKGEGQARDKGQVRKTEARPKPETKKDK